MRRKFISAFVLVMIMCSASYASDWKGYFKLGWDNVTGYVTGLFNSKDTSTKASPDKILPPHLSDSWGGLTDDLTGALKLRDKNDTLPRKTWIPFREDQRSNTKKINALLDKALGILVQGEAGDIRKQASDLRDRTARARLELDNLRNKRINAPEKTRLFWKLTKSKADEKIAALEEEISDNEKALNEISSKLAASLRDIGLELDDAQAEILLNSVTGDDLMNNAVVFSNVKIVVTKLEELSQNNTNTLDITRKYTGMYLVLNDLLLHTQEELMNKIEGEYKPRLSAIISEAEAARKDAMTRSNQNIYTQTQRKSFALNAQSNAVTIQAAKLYIELLNSQKASSEESIRKLKLNRDLAENTYRTVRSSVELRGLIHSGLGLFDAVNELSMPELKVFESDAMRLEFEELNRRLRGQ